MGVLRFSYEAKDLASKASSFTDLCEQLEREAGGLREYFPNYEADLIDLEASVKKVALLFRAKIREWS